MTEREGRHEETAYLCMYVCIRAIIDGNETGRFPYVFPFSYMELGQFNDKGDR